MTWMIAILYKTSNMATQQAWLICDSLNKWKANLISEDIWYILSVANP